MHILPLRISYISLSSMFPHPVKGTFEVFCFWKNGSICINIWIKYCLSRLGEKKHPNKTQVCFWKIKCSLYSPRRDLQPQNMSALLDHMTTCWTISDCIIQQVQWSHTCTHQDSQLQQFEWPVNVSSEFSTSQNWKIIEHFLSRLWHTDTE